MRTYTKMISRHVLDRTITHRTMSHLTSAALLFGLAAQLVGCACHSHKLSRWSPLHPHCTVDAPVCYMGDWGYTETCWRRWPYEYSRCPPSYAEYFEDVEEVEEVAPDKQPTEAPKELDKVDVPEVEED